MSTVCPPPPRDTLSFSLTHRTPMIVNIPSGYSVTHTVHSLY